MTVTQKKTSSTTTKTIIQKHNSNQNNYLVKRIARCIWKKLDTPLPAIIPGGDAGLLILTTIGSILAYTGTMMLLIKEIASGFVGIITDVPNFEFAIVDGVESGNFSFLMFSILRDASFYFFVLVFLIFGLLLILKQAQLVTSETLKNMVKSACVGIIIVMVFPYLWDPISDMSEMSAIMVLNPLYSFDDENPCITSDDPRAALLADYQKIMKEKSSVGGMVLESDSICSPELRPDYLFSKAIFGASLNLEFQSENNGEWWNVLDHINAYVTTISQGIFGIMFEGITKTTILFFLASMTALVGSMRHLLTDVIAIGLPILLVLRCIPFWGIDKLSDTLTSVFVPLLFIPFLTALIISAGSASLLTQEMDVGIIDSKDDLSSLGADRYLFWMYSIATLSLAVMSPVMFVPMLGSVASMMGKMVMTGTMTGVMGATGAAQGMIHGGSSAFSGLAAGGNMSKMGALKSMFTNPHSMGSVLGGVSSGAMASAKNAFRNDFGGANRIMPGAGQAFFDERRTGGGRGMDGDPAGGESSKAYANAFEQGQRVGSGGDTFQSSNGDGGNDSGKESSGGNNTNHKEEKYGSK